MVWNPETWSLSEGCASRTTRLVVELTGAAATEVELRRATRWLRHEINAGFVPAANISTHSQRRLLIVPPLGQRIARHRWDVAQRKRLFRLLDEVSRLTAALREEAA